MHLTVPGKDAGSQFIPAPQGVHPAVCVAVIDLGTQTSEFNGEVKSSRQLQIRFELDTEEKAGDRPFSVSRTFTASLHPKAGLRQALEAWSGKALAEGKFEFGRLLGRGCQIQIVHKTKANGDTVATIKTIMPLAKGMKAPQPSIEPFVFSLDEFDEDLFGSFSDGMKKWIAKSPEYQKIIAPPAKVKVVETVRANGKHPDPAGFGGPSFSDDLDDEIPW